MDVSALAEEKVQLQLTLQAISMCNVYGKKMDDLVALEKQKIEAVKRLNEIDTKITEYTSPYQSQFSQRQ